MRAFAIALLLGFWASSTQANPLSKIHEINRTDPLDDTVTKGFLILEDKPNYLLRKASSLSFQCRIEPDGKKELVIIFTSEAVMGLGVMKPVFFDLEYRIDGGEKKKAVFATSGNRDRAAFWDKKIPARVFLSEFVKGREAFLRMSDYLGVAHTYKFDLAGTAQFKSLLDDCLG